MIRVVAFDAGNTIMYDLDEFQHLGSMVNWPYVKVVPGIEDALKALQDDYRLVIATNAVMSTAAQVRAALARVDLDGYFSDIWTALDLGLAKPQPAYYAAMFAACDCDPAEMVMVGDTFSMDVRGPRQAGMRAIWYNANGAPVPADSPVQPDAILRDLAELPAAIRALDGA